MNFQPVPKHIPLPSDEMCMKLGRNVEIYHPGYSRPKPLIFLRATDQGGVYYGVAYYACCIVANNIWSEGEGRNAAETTHPFLSKSADPKDTRYVPEKDVIPAGTYYFHVPTYTNDPPYPIIPQFAYWPMPKKLPKPWEDIRPKNHNPFISSTRYAAYDVNRAPCCLSARTGALEEGHMMPKSSQDWLVDNEMRQYLNSGRQQAVHLSTENKVYLSNEIHYLFDENVITLIPKPYPADGKYRLVSHVLKPLGKSADSDVELVTLYQNIPLLPIPHVPVEFIFARFAWSIFTSAIITLFADDIRRKDRFSVLVPENKRGNSYKPLIQKILTLKQFKPPQSKASGVGEKHDIGQVDEEYPIVRRSSDLVYSVRTGELVPYDDPREPGDCGCNEYYIDNSDVPTKRSRLSSPTQSGGESEVEWLSDTGGESEAEGGSEVEGESKEDDANAASLAPTSAPDLSSSIISSGSSDPSLSQDNDHILPKTLPKFRKAPTKEPYYLYNNITSKHT